MDLLCFQVNVRPRESACVLLMFHNPVLQNERRQKQRFIIIVVAVGYVELKMDVTVVPEAERVNEKLWKLIGQ